MIPLAFPIPLFMLASLGFGSAVCLSLWRSLPALSPEKSPALFWVTAYFLGQGLLATAFLCLAVASLFTPTAVWVFIACGGIVGAACLWLLRISWLAPLGTAWRAWLEASLIWKLLALATFLLAFSGLLALGGGVEGDAIAYYLAVSKLTAYTHRLDLMPSYEDFTAVGLLAEMLLAALISMGMPDVSPGMFTWVNFLPALLLFYTLARYCGLGRRGATLALAVPVTSSAVLLLWGGGKTDLVAVGPALSACLLALASWEQRGRRVCLTLTGLLFGFAAVFKLSYLLPLFPGIVLLIFWQALIDALRAIRTRDWRAFGRLLRPVAADGTVFVIAFACALIPHVVKNLLLLGTMLGYNPLDSAWYSPDTVRRLLLSYPLALTYGRYWAQLGDLSPLVLAFAPLAFFLPRSACFRESRLAALSAAALFGLGLWMALKPSIFMPRYILATLLLLGIPAAAGAERYSRRGLLNSLTVAAAALVAMAAMPLHMNSMHKPYSLDRFLRYLSDPKPVYAAAPMESYCLAHEAINAAAPLDARVVMLTYYRYWLRPDLLLHASTGPEFASFVTHPDTFWLKAKEWGFRYLLMDVGILPVAKTIIAAKPDGVVLRELYIGGSQAAYEIGYDEP